MQAHVPAVAKVACVHAVAAKQWLGRFRKWSEIAAWEFVFSDSHCQHFFSIGETEGSDGERIWPKRRIGVFVYFELYTDAVGLQVAKIWRRASREEVEHYLFGPRVEYTVIAEHISDCARKRKRGLPNYFRAAADFLDG